MSNTNKRVISQLIYLAGESKLNRKIKKYLFL